MRHWLRLATSNWLARPVRTLGAILAVAIGTGAVVWVSSSHESVRNTLTEWAERYIGDAHLTVTSTIGPHAPITQTLAERFAGLKHVQVATPRLLQRLRGQLTTKDVAKLVDYEHFHFSTRTPELDVHGIDLETEFQMRSYDIVAGRMLRPDDGAVAVVERAFAEEQGVSVGDVLLLWTGTGVAPKQIEIIGLVARERFARLQRPMVLMRLRVLQDLAGLPAEITSVDLKLDASPDEGAGFKGRLAATARGVRRIANREAEPVTVRSAESRMRQINQAQNNQALVLVLLSSVAMFTALFIILSTLSMGLIERVRQLGLLRCIGMTRGQLGRLALLEVLPVGVLGVAAGVPLGMLLTYITVQTVPEYVGTFAVSLWGVGLACLAGFLTAVLAGVLPALAVLRVSPMEATRPRARQSGWGAVIAAALAAIALFAFQRIWLLEWVERDVDFLYFAAFAIGVLYIAYAALTPLAVRLIAAPTVVVAAWLLRVRPRLLQDQVGYAVWRAAGIACGLMVGLSLIVAILVINQSVVRGWSFPSEFPEAFVWSVSNRLPADTTERLAQVDGIAEFSVANAFNTSIEERSLFGGNILRSKTWYLGVDPNTFFDLVNLDFLPNQGDRESALAKLREGGHILVADDFARSRNKWLGDTVRVANEGKNRWQNFTIAGVVRSPAIDIAAGYFQVQATYSATASGSVIGTLDELRNNFGIDAVNVAFMNLKIDDERPADWPPAPNPDAAELPDYVFDRATPLNERWRRYKSEAILDEIRARMNTPDAAVGSVSELKARIDSELMQMTRLLTAIPTVALFVAAIGVANLMTASVTARNKQLAIIRAVGGTRGLILRMVIGEALVLGLLGSALGLALGLDLAGNITLLVERMWGLRVAIELPWGYLSGAALFCVGLCILAGLLPARHASRTNVIDALHTA